MNKIQSLTLLLVVFSLFSCAQQSSAKENRLEDRNRGGASTIESDQSSGYVLLYDSNFRQGWSSDIGRTFDSILIGYWKDGSWESYEENLPPIDQDIVLYTPMMETIEASISDAFIDEFLGGPFLALDFSDEIQNFEGKMIGVNSDWDTTPRPMDIETENLNWILMDIRVYGSAQLKDMSMDVLKTISTDLDGNGEAEIVCLTKVFAPVYYYNAESDVPGADWVTLIIERTKQDEVRIYQLDEIILSPDWHLANAEIWCIDLNGDESIEIVEARDYYEFHSYVIYSYDGDKCEKISSNGFGV